MRSNSSRLLRLSAGLLIALVPALPCAAQLPGPARGDLMIRDHAGDDGGPQEGVTFYVSPDIVVGDDELVVDQDNSVTVRIRNRGSLPVHQAAVDLYRTPFSTAPPYDLDLSQPSVDIHAPGVVTRWILVGRNTLQDVAPGQPVESSFVVRPRSNERHLCFLAVIHSPEDPFELVRENSPRIITLNNNVAQRNFNPVQYPRSAYGKIEGLKWNDLNGNGQREPDEPGLPGVTVYLDYNGNLALDPGEPTAITDAQGQYQFDRVFPQRYVVREVVPSGWNQTSPGGSGVRIANVSAEQTVSNINFGNRESKTPLPTPTPGQITGIKWNDLNGNGKRDPDEPGLPGVTVYLDLSSNGAPDPGEPTATTSADDPATPDVNEAGRYRFPDLRSQLYIVREVVPTDSTQTYPGAPAGGSAAAHVVQLAAGQTAADVNFGNRGAPELPPPTGEITGIKWEDSNGNETREPDEFGIPNVTIYLDLNNNAALDPGEPTASTVTIADAPATLPGFGRYRFRDLKPGRYTVREVVPDGSTQTFPGAPRTPGGPANAHVVEVAAGQVVEGINFGNQKTPQPRPPVPPPCPRPSAVTFLVSNQDRCRPKRVELVIDARHLPQGTRVALVLPGIDHSVNIYNLQPGCVTPGQLEQPGDPCAAAVQEAAGGRAANPCVPAFYLIPGSVARITDILVLPAHAVPAQLVVVERTGIGPGAPFEIRLEQRENGCGVGGVAIGVRMAAQ